MMIIKIMAVVMLAGSVGISSNKASPGIKQAAPSSFDLRIDWRYNAAVGYNQLWAYTASGGGITQQVLFTQTANYWVSTIPNFFYQGEFVPVISIPRNTDNDAYFNQLGSTSTYYYNSIDNNISWTKQNGLNFTVAVNVYDANYFVSYKRDISAGYNYASTYNERFVSGSATSARVLNLSTTADYYYTASFGVPSRFYVYDNNLANGTLVNDTLGLYFRLFSAANIEGDDYWSIYNAGVGNGYSAGYGDGERAGIDIGRLENTAWEDAFTIIKGAVDTVGDVMSISLFGPVTIGTLVSIPLIVGLLFWIIDKWRGS